MPEVETIELLWRLLPAALIIPFITFFLGRLGTTKERRLEYRTFFHAAEMKKDYGLTDYPQLKDGTKLLLPKQFEITQDVLAEQFQKNLFETPPKIDYIKLNAFGKSIITGCSMSIKVKNHSTNKNYDIRIALPILEKEEEVFIPFTCLENINEQADMYREKIEIKYTTQAGEKLLFESIIKENKKGEKTSIDRHSVRFLWFFYRPISSIRGEEAVWSTLESNAKERQ